MNKDVVQLNQLEPVDREFCIRIANTFMNNMIDDEALNDCYRYVHNVFVEQRALGKTKTNSDEEIEFNHMMRRIKEKARGLNQKDLGTLLSVIEDMQKGVRK